MTRSAVLASALLLGGCVSFGAKPPALLLTLTPTTTVTPGATRTAGPGETISILAPVAPAAIATARIPVYSADNSLAYVKDVAWNEPPARLFQRLLQERVAQATGRIVIDTRLTAFDPGAQLSGQLQSFGVDPSGLQAVVVFDGTRQRGNTVEQRRFEARVPITAVEGAEVGRGLNQAANDVANQVAEWVR